MRTISLVAAIGLAACGSGVHSPTLIPKPSDGYQALRINQQIDFPYEADWLPRKIERGTVLIGDRASGGALHYCGLGTSTFGPVQVCAVKRGQKFVFLGGILEYELRPSVPPGAVEETRFQ